MTAEDNIRSSAEQVVATFAEHGLGFDERSVEWIDGYIERNRGAWDADTAASIGNMLGSFLAECVIRNYGGHLEMTENGLAILFDERNAVYPLNKVHKQIANGAEDSIASFYQVIPIVFNRF